MRQRRGARARRRSDLGAGSLRDRPRRLPLSLSARADGNHPRAGDQYRTGQAADPGADECVRAPARVSAGKLQVRGSAEFRYALLVGVARSVEGADDRLGAGYRRTLLPAADARHVDRCLRRRRQAHHRHGGRGLRARPAGLAGSSARRRRADRRADAHCVDHRADADQWGKGLSGGSHGSGRFPCAGAVASGRRRSSAGADIRSGDRYDHAAAAPARRDAGGAILHGGDGSVAPAGSAPGRSTDPRAHATHRSQLRRRLRFQCRRAGDPRCARARRRRCVRS